VYAREDVTRDQTRDEFSGKKIGKGTTSVVPPMLLKAQAVAIPFRSRFKFLSNLLPLCDSFFQFSFALL
jgi:hypothetical protein